MIIPQKHVRGAPIRRHNVLRRCVVVMLLLVYTTTAVGLPLPLGGQSVNQGEGAYPCAASACGCRSAEQCWSSCCCHTLAERLAWAKRRGIQPPCEAIDKARRQGLDVSWLGGPGAAAETRVCGPGEDCAAGRACRRAASPQTASHGKECCNGRSNAVRADSAEPSTPDRAILLSALRCQGKSITWLAAVVQMVDVQPVATGDASVVGQLAPPALCLVSSCEAVPPVPPPEAAPLG